MDNQINTRKRNLGRIASSSSSSPKPAAQTRNRVLTLQAMGPTSSRKQISAQSSSSSASGFQLPDDWKVEERPRRSNPCHVDKYYYEPGTGRQFRSLSSVRNYLTGETDVVQTTDGADLGTEKKMQIVPSAIKRSSALDLPDGWVLEEIPRRNLNFAGKIDKFYIEPGAGQRFRSLRSAQKYLAERGATLKASKPQDQSTNQKFGGKICSLKVVLKHSEKGEKNDNTHKALKQSNHSMSSASSGPSKCCHKEAKGSSTPDSSSIPAKVKWVLNGPWGNVWTPFMDDAIVSQPEKQKWSEAFVTTLNHGF